MWNLVCITKAEELLFKLTWFGARSSNDSADYRATNPPFPSFLLPARGKKNRRDQQRQRNVSPAAQWQIIHNLAQKFDLAAVNTVARPRPRLRPSPRRFVLVFFHSRFSLVGFSCAANTYFCLSSCLAIRRFA